MTNFIRRTFIPTLIASLVAVGSVEAADNCNGNSDLVVIFDVIGIDDTYQDMYFTNQGGNQRYETLWYTPPLPATIDPNTTLFMENELDNGIEYSVKIEHDQSTITSYYYLKLKSEDDSAYEYKGDKVKAIKHGNLESTGTEITSIDCSADTVVLPPPPDIELPEICPLFTGPAQRWDGSFAGNIEPEIHIQNASSINGTFNNGEIGFNSADNFRDDGRDGCDGFVCVGNPDLMVVEPVFENFNNTGIDDVEPSNGSVLLAGNYNKIKVSNDVTLLGGEYFIENLEIKGSGKLTISSKTVLHLHKLKVEDGGEIDTTALSDNELFIFAESNNKVEIKSDFDFKALIVSNNEVELHKGATLSGGVTSPYIDIHDASSINSTIPASCTPESPPEIPELCEIFPKAVQSWADEAQQSSLTITGGPGDRIKGTTDGNVGFQLVNIDPNLNITCDGVTCNQDASLLLSEPPELPFNPPEDRVVNIGWTSEKEPIEEGSYTSITLSSGQYEFTGSDYEIGSLRLTGGGTLYIHANTLIRVNQLDIGNGSKVVVEGGNGDEDFVIWGEYLGPTTPNIKITLDESSPLPANIFSRGQVNLSGTAVLNGSITANKINIIQSAKIQRTSNTCEQPELPDMCPYFPNVSQTWVGSEGDKLHVGSNENSRILGAVQRNGEYFVGYSQGNIDKANNILCNGQACKGGDDLKLTEAPDFESMTFDNSSLGNYDLSGNETLAPGDYGFITIDDGEIVTLSSGSYNIQRIDIKDGRLKVEDGSQVLLYVHRLEVKEHGSIQHSGNPDNFSIVSPSTSHRKADGRQGEESKIKFDSKNIDSVIGYNFSALIMAKKKVELRETVRITGAITTPEVHVHDNSMLIEGVPDECHPSTGSTLVITPKTAQALTCDRIPVDFSVVDSNGAPISGYNQSFVATAGSLPNGTACWSEQSSGGICSGLDFTSRFIDGEKTLYLESTTVGELDVSASVASDSLSTTEGPYRFVPFGFQFNPDPAKAIAGKPFTVQIKAVADAGGSCEVIENYTGTKDLTLSSTNYQEPTTGSKVVIATDTNITFSQGTADLELTYLDAGHVSVTVSDLDWTKEECGADCEDYQGEWEGLSGDAQIHSRPYTFALCNIEANLVGGSVSNPQGTSIGPLNGGFTAAGDLFALYSKPIIWQNGDMDSGSVDLSTKDYCAYPTTPNYSKADALAAKQILSIPSDEPHSPAGGEPGILSGDIDKQHTEGTSGIYSYSGLSWNEVGSILLTSNLEDVYYDMTVSPSTIPVGRFYPAKLVLIEDHFVYPSGQDEEDDYVGFAYMNQGIGHDFIVEAQNRQSEPTYNYGLFARGVMVDIEYQAIDENDVDITSRLDSENWCPTIGRCTLSWDGSYWGKADINGVVSNARLALHTSDFMMTKLPDPDPSSTNYTTKPDGPFDDSNSEFGLWVSNKIDGVDFETLDLNDEGKKFTEQPNFRYGRMALKDVGANTGQEVRVPLRTEYWDSEIFIINPDDRRSGYVSQQRFCRQRLWTNGTNNTASLSGTDTVDEGRSEELVASHTHQSDSHREQVRLWLRQGSDSPQRTETGVDCTSNGGSFTNQPWLQYNWRDQGDEDPSTVVTFGTFRGNDRIIFKGERALMGN